MRSRRQSALAANLSKSHMEQHYSFRLIAPADMDSIIPLLMELDPSIEEKILKQRLKEMLGQNYQCVGIYEGSELIGVSGLWFLTKYYVGKHIEPDNVFIRPQHQGKGVGHQLMQWIYNYARENGCIASELNCYVSNKSGQKFWESEGYEAIGIHYQRKL